MIETRNIDELTRIIRQAGSVHIGIDGTDGVGKTTLAKALSEILGFYYVSLDCFLQKNKGGFLSCLDYTKIENLLKSHRCFIVEGICLLEVMSRVNVQLEVLVYIKRLQHGTWPDERELAVEGNIEDFIRKELELINSSFLRNSDKPENQCMGIAEEIIRYHNSYKPQEKANILYMRECE